MMRSLKDTDGKVGGLKPAGFLHNHLTPAFRTGLLRCLQVNHAQ